MGDAYTLQQCPVDYLKTELTRLRRLQHLYEQELQQRGLSVIEEPGGEITCERVLVQNTGDTSTGHIQETASSRTPLRSRLRMEGSIHEQRHINTGLCL